MCLPLWASSISCLSERNAALPDGRTLQSLLVSDTPVLWVFQGDSVTLGMSCHLKGGRSYVDLWEELIRWEWRNRKGNRVNDAVVNVAQSGETAEDFLKREPYCMAPLRPQVIFIHYGINEALYGVSPDTYRRAMEQLVERARSRGAVPVLIIPPLTRTPVAQVQNYEDAMRSLADEKQVLLVDCAADWRESQSGGDAAPSAWMADDLHPDIVGHRLILRALAQSLNIVPEISETLRLPTNGKEYLMYEMRGLRRFFSDFISVLRGK